MAFLGNLVTYLTANASQLYQTLSQAGRKIRDYREENEKSESKTFSLYRRWIQLGAAIGAALLLIRAVKNTIAVMTGPIKAAAAAESMRIQFGVLLKDMKAGADLFAKLDVIAQRTTFGSEDIQESAKKLLAYGFSVDELIPTLHSLSDVAAATGQRLQDLAYTYGTIKSSGKVLSRDIYQQLAGLGVPVLKPLAEVLGIKGTENEQQEQLQRMIEDGLVRFEHVRAAFAKMTGDGGALQGIQATLEETLVGKWNRLVESIQVKYRELGEKMVKALGISDLLDEVFEMVNGDILTGAIDYAIAGLKELSAVALNLFNELWAFFQNEGAELVATLVELAKAVFILMIESLRFALAFNRATQLTVVLSGAIWMLTGVVEILSYAFHQLTGVLQWMAGDWATKGRVFLHPGVGQEKAKREAPEWFKGLAEWFKEKGLPDTFEAAGKTKPIQPAAAIVAGSREAHSAIVRAMFGASKEDKQLKLQQDQIAVEREQLRELQNLNRMMKNPQPAVGFE